MRHVTETACSNCGYWHAVESPPGEEHVGECRFNPPTFHPVTEDYRSGGTRHSMMEYSISSRETMRPEQNLGVEQSFWPMTRGQDWCGKFEQSPVAQDRRSN